MPRLECSAVNCRYNQEHGCVRENISVGGAGANSTSETCCDSFEEKRGDTTFTNSFQEPSLKVNIRCEAKKCVHNDDCSCQADGVDVSGSNACRCEQTACGTFCRK